MIGVSAVACVVDDSDDAENESPEHQTPGRSHPQTETNHQELACPFAPAGNRSLRHPARDHLAEHPPQRRTCTHRDQEASSAARRGHPEKRHHGKCHHQKDERHDPADRTVDNSGAGEPCQPEKRRNQDRNRTATPPDCSASCEHAPWNGV